jgi:hypothetical protein
MNASRVVLAVLALVLAGAFIPPATGSREERPPPKLLWKAYPLKDPATARDVATINRALTIFNERAAAKQPGRRTPTALIVFLGLAALVIGVAALPGVAIPEPRVAGLVARRRAELVLAGAVLLLGVLIALVLGVA